MEHPTSPQPVLCEVSQLSVAYDKTAVLLDVTFSIPGGLLVGIIGPNGAGKSTLIKAALGIVKPLAGTVEFFGQTFDRVRKKIAYVPQRETVDWDFPMTVNDLVLMGCYGRLGLIRRPTAADKAAAEHTLKRVGMEDYADRQISQLSGGQQQRVFLARALLQEADIYFLDEPFAGIDKATEAVIMQLLQNLRSSGKTIFIVHHDLHTVKSYFDWVILLNRRLIAYGETDRFFTPHYLNVTYGQSYSLLNEALRFSTQKLTGANG